MAEFKDRMHAECQNAITIANGTKTRNVVKEFKSATKLDKNNGQIPENEKPKQKSINRKRLERKQIAKEKKSDKVQSSKIIKVTKIFRNLKNLKRKCSKTELNSGKESTHRLNSNLCLEGQLKRHLVDLAICCFCKNWACLNIKSSKRRNRRRGRKNLPKNGSERLKNIVN